MRSLVVSLLLTGCASMPQLPGAESAGDAVTEMNTEPETGKPPHKRKPPETVLEPTHVIIRSELSQVLDRSPAYFLQKVQTEPRFVAGRFAGWRVVSFFPGDPRFARVDLRPGDVVTRINGRPIEEPDQFMVVWERLRVEPELVLEMERNGAPRTLRWTIADK